MAFPVSDSIEGDAHGATGAAAPSWRKRMTARLSLRSLLLIGLSSATAVVAQGTAMSGDTETEAGIPVTDATTKEKCGACHTADAKGNLSRISWVRTTPEGWAQAIKRMVKLLSLIHI